MPWCIFHTPAAVTAQAVFAHLWGTALFRSREACLFMGASTPRLPAEGMVALLTTLAFPKVPKT